MLSDSQKVRVIREFRIPDALKDDIAYCQRSLRDCVKVHQHFVEKCNSLSAFQQEQVKQYLHELEDEMRAIGQEQNTLVSDLTYQLKLFQRKTASERHIVLGDDLANGYVAWVLSTHAEINCNAAFARHTVSKRLTESQLYQKYPLEPVPCYTVAKALPDGPKRKERRPRRRPVLQTSLLKPKEERDLSNAALKEEPSLTPPGTPIAPPTPPPPPPSLPAATITRSTASRRKTLPERPLILKKMLRSRSTTPVAATLKQELEVKQEPIDPENSIEADDQLATITLQETAAVKRGRSNLLQALNKVKSAQKTILKQQQTSPPVSAIKSARNNRASSVNGGEQRSTSVSSDSCNSRASTPGTACNGGGGNTRKTTAENGTSDESSIERLLAPPEEPPCNWPTNIDEWEQYSFLKLFGLYTIEDSNLLKGRKNERKRRSCCSTERKDFHYGRFDYYEQQFVQKRRYNVNKRLLFTTAEKSIKKGKPWSSLAAPVALPVEDLPTDRKPSFPSGSLATEHDERDVLEPEKALCCVCKVETATANTLSACMDCSNLYHPSCHVEEAQKPEDGPDGDENGNRSTVVLRNELCPVCFTLAKSRIK